MMKKIIIVLFIFNFFIPQANAQLGLNNFAIYYGYLSRLNISTLKSNPQFVAKFLGGYNAVVLGEIADPAHPDYAFTIKTIPLIKKMTTVFGYIALGQKHAHSTDKLLASIKQFHKLGVDGIFVDEAGFEFWNNDKLMRIRSNIVLTAIHKLNMKVFLNAWDPDDLFVKEKSNPLLVTAGDIYLFESYIYNANHPFNFDQHVKKIKKISQAKQKFNIECWAVNTLASDKDKFSQAQYDQMAKLAYIEGLEAISWGTYNFSATAALMEYRWFNTEYNKTRATLLPVPIINYDKETISKLINNKTFTFHFDR